MFKTTNKNSLPILILSILVCFAHQVFAQRHPLKQQVRSQRIISLQNKGSLPNQGFIVRATDLSKVQAVLREAGLEKYTREVQPYFRIIQIDLEFPLIDSLLIKPGLIDFIDIKRQPMEEGIVPGYDPGANKLNRLFSNYKTVNGNGLVLSIKEKRFDSTDIDFLNRVKPSPVGATEVTSHATRMATMAAGAGNSTEFSKGAAWGAGLFSASFDNLMPESPGLYSSAGISVQNHSYGTAIENFYGADAAAYDAVSTELPFLFHVFSAGNLGEEKPGDGTYKDLNWANLSGSFKMSKNSISVGAIDSFFRIESRSSRGPAYDGRIKPELVAFGQDGSSGAAAIVSGIAVTLQHRYFIDHNKFAHSALVKAVLINSATDLLSPGPDFQSGFGNADAYEAMKLMEAKNYLVDSARDKETKEFFIEVPAGSKTLKLLLCWVDPPAPPNAEKALVNDLDLKLVHPLGNIMLPWVLNPAAHSDSLTSNAKKGIDTLNNVEQITIDDPAPGRYTIRVSASVKAGIQPFAITWLIKKPPHFSWSYPDLSDKLISGKNALLRWNEGLIGPGTLAYRMIPGNWHTLKSVDLSVPYSTVSIPDSSGLIQFSMQAGKDTVLTDSFAIFQETNLQVGYVCRDSFLLSWKNIGADSFRLYRLAEQYMEPIYQGKDSFYTSKINQHKYFAIAPLVNGIEGYRSLTRQYEYAGVGCYLKSFLVDLIEQQARLSFSLSTLINLYSISIEKLRGSQWITLAHIDNVNLSQFEFFDSSLIQGMNSYRIRINLSNGATIYAPVEKVFYFSNKDFILYPNPAPQNGLVNLATRDTEDLWISLVDALGRKWIQRKVDDIGEKLSLNGLPAGIYFYRLIRKDRQVAAGRLVIQ